MPLASVVHRNPASLAEALQHVSTERGPHRHRLAFNRFAEPQNQHTWWLSPNSEHPAYAWGKVVVTNIDTKPELYVGLYVEKGMGKQAAPIFSERTKSARMIMRENWIWHDFSRALTDGTIHQAVVSTSKQIGSPVLIALDAQMATPSLNWDDDRTNLPRDYIRFAMDERFVLEVPASNPELLGSLNEATSLRDVAERIAAFESLDWTWIDFQLGFSFSTESKEGVPPFDWEQVWAATGMQWRDWLRLSRTKR